MLPLYTERRKPLNTPSGAFHLWGRDGQSKPGCARQQADSLPVDGEGWGGGAPHPPTPLSRTAGVGEFAPSPWTGRAGVGAISTCPQLKYTPLLRST